MLSKRCKYALKALEQLARVYGRPDNCLSTPAIARAAQVPKKFLEQILLELKKAGLADSRAGATGGYFLVKAPTEIALAEVLRLIDGPIALLPCVSLKFYTRCPDCPDEAACGLRRVFTAVRQRDLELLTGFSVQSLIEDQDGYTDWSI
jgi:Rrf2 family protein